VKNILLELKASDFIYFISYISGCLLTNGSGFRIQTSHGD
jgi:hypothetical protein